MFIRNIKGKAEIMGAGYSYLWIKRVMMQYYMLMLYSKAV